MFKRNEIENVEIFFICEDCEGMALIETYYDSQKGVDYWYFNASLAYHYWRFGFKDLELQDLSKNLLLLAASKYLLYAYENKCTSIPDKVILKDLQKIDQEIEELTGGDQIITNL